ncbi:hypothetical protein [Halosimplex amylolyticum]|uniref:hypothetical protein n=1 Tax=Halosimplex amylolyticum TaxID=3396616 RepID=UPI003F55D135
MKPTSWNFSTGFTTAREWVAGQHRAMKDDAQPRPNPEPADAVASLLVGAAFALAGWQLFGASTAPGRELVVGYAAVGRATTALVGLAMIRYGGPEILSGLRMIKLVRGGGTTGADESVDVDDQESAGDADPLEEPATTDGPARASDAGDESEVTA